MHDVGGNVLATYMQEGSNPVALTEVPVYGSGRLGVHKPGVGTPGVGTTFYEVSDHLGNVRGIIGNPAPLDITATLEDNGQVSMTNPRVQEMAFFKNLSTTAITDANMNHSGATTAMPVPVYSSYLKWQDGVPGQESEDKSVGPAVGLKVEAGDQINLDAWAKYKKTGNFTKSGIYAAMASILGVNFVGTAPGLDPVSAATQIFQNGLTTAFGLSSGGTEQVPFAYLNYIIYDRSFNPVGGDRKRVTTSAGFDPGNEAFSSHEHLILPTINITEPGYIYIFVSNESENAEVWFDDLHVNQVKSSIVAGADYYPFGLPMENRQATREDYRYGYQGQYSESDKETNWNAFELRMYDARIGRWISPDPYGQFASPYLAMGNAPHQFTDSNGGACCGSLEEAIASGVHIGEEVTVTASRLPGGALGILRDSHYIGGGIPQSDLRATADFVKLNHKINAPSDLPPSTAPLMRNSPWPAPPTMRAAEPNGWASFRDQSIGNGMIYGAADATWVGLGTFFFKPFLGNDFYHLDGSYASNKDRQIGFAMAATMVISAPEEAAVQGVAQTGRVFIVTREGVVLPRGAKIPSEFIENPFRNSSYGLMNNGRFVEKLRIDPATPAGMKGPNFSHYHLNGRGKHFTGNWPWWSTIKQ